MLGVHASASSDIHGVVGELYVEAGADITNPPGVGWLAVHFLGRHALAYGPPGQWCPAALYRVDGMWQILVRRVVDPGSLSLFVAASLASWALREGIIQTDAGLVELAQWLVLPRPALEIALAEGLTPREIAHRFVTMEGTVAEQIAALRRARPGSGVYRALA